MSQVFQPLEHFSQVFVAILPRALLLGVGLICNGLMLSSFARALDSSPSTAVCMASNSAANFVASAVLGYLVYGDALSLRWLVGAVLILLGVTLIAFGAYNPLRLPFSSFSRAQ
jgi:drug/metabolite transporter (DMT)-like permease